VKLAVSPQFVGRLPQVPGVFSQGATLEELEENIRDAYRMMLDEQATASLTGLLRRKKPNLQREASRILARTASVQVVRRQLGLEATSSPP